VGVAAAAAVAAGVLVSLRQPAATQATQVVVSTSAPAATPTMPTQAPQPAAANPVAAAPGAAAPAPADDRGVDPSKLPRALPGQSAPPAVAANAPHARPAAPPAPAGAAAANAAPAADQAPAPGGEKGLDALMQQAVGSPANSPPVQPATAPGTAPDPAAGSVPLRPSLGAINGALGTAMPAARACVDADAPISHATVTFNSDGSVGNVSVTGWAAGKPAEACIRAALSKARVPPFAQPTYTVPATIRSN
jgi:hypothetical protein